MEDVTYFLYKKTKFQLELAYESEKLGLYNLYCKIVFSGKTLVYNSEDPAKSCENLKLPTQNCKSGHRGSSSICWVSVRDLAIDMHFLVS